MGAYRPKGITTAAQMEKGYRLRDTDDRITRQKIETERSRPSAGMTGAAEFGNGIANYPSSNMLFIIC